LNEKAEYSQFRTKGETKRERKDFKMKFKYESKGESISNMAGARRIGSQIRQHISYTEYRLLTVLDRQAIIEDTETGKKELWLVSDYNPGYTLQIGRWGYEFARSL
jgi:hypothetical protein